MEPRPCCTARSQPSKATTAGQLSHHLPTSCSSYVRTVDYFFFFRHHIFTRFAYQMGPNFTSSSEPSRKSPSRIPPRREVARISAVSHRRAKKYTWIAGILGGQTTPIRSSRGYCRTEFQYSDVGHIRRTRGLMARPGLVVLHEWGLGSDSAAPILETRTQGPDTAEGHA